METASGSYHLGSGTGRLLVRTGRAGMGARAGHDLTLEVTRWEGTLTLDTADPARSAVTVAVDAGSLAVRAGTGGVKPLTAADRSTIEQTAREKILHTDRYPQITFRSASVAADGESFEVTGDLTVAGRTHPVTVQGTRGPDGSLRGTATVVQSHWGIKPYSAFFGALRLADAVAVEFDLTLPAGPP